jgi:hypothetical protein
MCFNETSILTFEKNKVGFGTNQPFTIMKHPFLISLLLLFAACQKGADNNPADPTADCKLKSITYNFSPSSRTYNVVYSGQNISEISSSIDKTIYTYNPGGQLIKRETFNIGNTQVQFKTEFIYDGSGQLIEENNFEYFGGSLQATSKYTLSYNGNKRSQMNHYSNGGSTFSGKTFYTWTGDNISSIAYYNQANILECTTNFTYDLTKENSFFSNFSFFYLQDLYDEDLTHIYFLSKNQLTTNSSQCPTLETDTWSYTYNNQNLTKTVKITDNRTPSTTTNMWTFAYTCD